MRFITYAFLLLLIPFSGYAQRSPGRDDLPRMPDSLLVIKNRVKTVRMFSLDANGKRHAYKTFSYDSIGRIIVEKDAMEHSFHYEYDRNGQKAAAVQRDPAGRFVQRYVFRRNAADTSFTTTIYLSGDSLHPWRSFTMNSRNLCVRDTHYVSSGAVYSIQAMKYDHNDKMIARYDSSSTTRMAEWTSNGKKVARKTYDPSGHILHSYRFYYNKDGKIERITDSTGVMKTVEYNFTYSKGTLTEYRRNKTPMTESEISWLHSEFWVLFPRNEGGWSEFSGDDVIVRMTTQSEHNITYDASGNIIRDELRQTSGSFAETRVYEYEYEFY